jgi:inorganic triphosphatase YgiF
MEVEAKLQTSRPAVLAALARRRTLGPYELRPEAVRRLETVYLDTVDGDLSKRGVAVRIRRRERGGIELTVKLAGKVSRGVHHRPEWTWQLRNMPSMPFHPRGRELRKRLGRWITKAELWPLVGTRIHRRPLIVQRPDGGTPIAEIDLDRVEFFSPRGASSAAPRAGGRFYEIEIELLRGDDRDLARLVGALRKLYVLEPSKGSKLERALRWAGIRRLRS